MGQPDDAPTVHESALTDVSGLTLADLFANDTTVLGAAVRRVVHEVESAAQAISGWSSYVDGPQPTE